MNRSALLVAVLLVAACGSSGTASPSAPLATLPGGQPTAAGGQPTAAAGQSLPLPIVTVAPTDDSVDPGASADPNESPVVVAGIPPIPDGSWTKAQAHVEVTGSRTVTIDMIGAGFATQGSLIFTVGDQATTSAMQFVLSNVEGSGLSVSTGDAITSADVGKQCQVSVTRMEVAGIAGEVTCPNLEAINVKGTDLLRLNVHIVFTAAP